MYLNINLLNNYHPEHIRTRFSSLRVPRSNPGVLNQAKNWIASSQKTLLAMTMVILLSIINPITVFALPQDKKEKIFIVADSTVYNYKTRINVFTGHVKIDQGTTHITADKLITKSNAAHQIEEALAYGLETLAHYWTTPKTDEPEIHARAKIIKFYPIDSNIILEQQVLMTQADNSFQGQMILYNTITQTITVPASSQGRATLIYHPKKS
jgi:lipopolysaccharide export system protein LptA